jgi:uncharacterized protein with NAD-binding domain and iron-sulfur cluster
MPNGRLPRVAVLGGGAGAMTAAMWLSSRGWRKRYESITVYQMGWRLGGKGASGRGVYDRIEEHGLHVWLGFYDNAFRTLAAAYDELDREPDAPLASIADAFEPSNLFIAMEEGAEGWTPWIADFPTNPRRPWDPGPRRLPTLWEYLQLSLSLALEFVRSTSSGPSSAPSSGLHLAPVGDRAQPRAGLRLGPAPLSAADHLRRFSLSFVNAWREATRVAEIAIGDVLTIVLELIGERPEFATVLPAETHSRVVGLLDDALDAVHTHIELAHPLSEEARRTWYLVDILVACARGVMRDGLLFHPEGFDAVDHYDFRDWLTRHGCSDESANCTLIRTVVYDMAFAYAEGDPNQPSCSAASALRGLARMFFTYRGSIAWKMRAGMGDAVFAPMYECLRERGVKFKFFHRVEALHLSDDRRSIGSIDIDVQAQLADGIEEYSPLVDVHGLPCWPARPCTEQLEDVPPETKPEEFESFWSRRPAAKLTLREGEDFDQVVLGIAIGSFPYICNELIAADPRWRRMVDEVATVYTQAFQLWLGENLNELGCVWPEATVGGYLEPFDTYADMPQLIERESWPAETVKGIAYFCNVMPTPPGVPDPGDVDLPVRAHEEAKKNALDFLDRSMLPLWPLAVDRYPTEFRWRLLQGGADDVVGRSRFDAQFWRANVEPSERYVLSLPGTGRFRLPPGDSGFDNLFLAGDWTRCGLNAGCVEAAVTSGMLAANAMCGVPEMKEIIGCDQP